MALHLRQVCLVAENLAPAIDDLKAVLSLNVCFVDPIVGKWGLENSLLTVGTQFLEVVAPTEGGTSAGRHLARRGGDGGYMVICQVPTQDEQAALLARAEAEGVRVAYAQDWEASNLRQLHPGDMMGAYLETDWDAQQDVHGNWHPAGGTDWRGTACADVASEIVGVELQGPDPVALAERWSAVIGAPAERRDGALTLDLANASLTFVEATDGRGPGLSAVTLKSADPDRLRAQAGARGCLVDGAVVVCGTRFDIAA